MRMAEVNRRLAESFDVELVEKTRNTARVAQTGKIGIPEFDVGGREKIFPVVSGQSCREEGY
jgi:hypothetical protein